MYRPARLDCCAPSAYAPGSSFVHTCEEHRDVLLSDEEMAEVHRQWRESRPPIPDIHHAIAAHPSNYKPRRSSKAHLHVCTPWCGHDIVCD